MSETLSLAHDLGHTPFGHSGEDALHECMNDYGGFDHNLQTLRIVMFIENKYLKFKGLNLTTETLDGLSAYYEDLTETAVSNTTELIQPIVILGVASVIGFIAVAVIQGIYSTLGAVN